ncbi:alpha/beta fold hydrolase [Streptomyces polyrhachis]|uniref:Alpha/beta fold hydrolase n=1 Tax=Streptomyces polyrhachis TaxID=1282885 RepID=A0ABW2GBW3_9ACTN
MTPDDAELDALLAHGPVAPERSFRYGDHPSQVVDLYGTAYEGTGAPVIALLHGGFWRERYDRTHLSPLAAALAADLGRCVALVEYRRVGGGGGFPATFDDLPPALAALPGARPVTLVGHSAGGHLALWAAARCPAAVASVVAVSPVADLALAHELALSDDAVGELLGGADLVAQRLDETDPMRMPPPPAPVTLLHGALDTTVPAELSRRYAQHATGELRELPGTGHYAPVTPGTGAYGVLAGAAAGGEAPRTGEHTGDRSYQG